MGRLELPEWKTIYLACFGLAPVSECSDRANKKSGDIAVTALIFICFKLLSKSFYIFLNTFCLICCNIRKRYLLSNKISASFSDKSPE